MDTHEKVIYFLVLDSHSVTNVYFVRTAKRFISKNYKNVFLVYDTNPYIVFLKMSEGIELVFNYTLL